MSHMSLCCDASILLLNVEIVVIRRGRMNDLKKEKKIDGRYTHVIIIKIR